MLRVIVLALFCPLPGVAAVLTVDLQPVRVCTAESCGEPGFDAALLRQTWRQASIRIDVLEALATPDLTIARTEGGELQSLDALAAFRRSFAPDRVAANTIYLGFSGPFDGGIVGRGYQNAPQTSLYPFAIMTSHLDPAVSAFVAAHEVGHVLGAGHLEDPAGENLMSPFVPLRVYSDAGFVAPIRAPTREAVRASPLLAPVPVPPAGALSGLALLLLAALGWCGVALRSLRQQPNALRPAPAE